MKRLIILLILVVIAASCSEEEPEADCTQSDLALAINNTDDSECGQDNGKIEVVASGGMTPYSYSLNGTGNQASGNFEDLAPGTYEVTVTDANLCERSQSIEIFESNTIEVLLSSSDAGCETSQGTIEVSASGGVGFQFKLDDGSYQSSSTFTGLSAGQYTVTARDENGCEESVNVRVNSGVSYSSQVEDVILTNCATEGCHVAGTSVPDWTVFTNVQENADNIKSQTQAGTMPPGDLTLSDEEIALIACWVDDGALDN